MSPRGRAVNNTVVKILTASGCTTAPRYVFTLTILRVVFFGLQFLLKLVADGVGVD
jgi:hypothetical protein